MITIQQSENLIDIAVMGEFTLADFKQFEVQVVNQLDTVGSINLLFDLRDMLDYTIDVALEEMKFFGREHPTHFNKIAVVTNDQWIIWQAWLSRLFVEAEIRPFAEYEEARAWVSAE